MEPLRVPPTLVAQGIDGSVLLASRLVDKMRSFEAGTDAVRAPSSYSSSWEEDVRIAKADCQGCALEARCCPKAEARKVMRSVHEGARDLARAIPQEEEWLTSRRERKKVEMLLAHLKRILRLDRLRLRGPNGARDESQLAAAAQNLCKLAKLIPMPLEPAPA